MKKYQELKKNSKKSLKYHLFYSIIVCFLTTSILNFSYKIDNLGVINHFLQAINLDKFIAPILKFKPTYGVFASFFTQLSGTGSIALSILNVINNFVFKKIMPSSYILILSVLTFLLLYVFVSTIINVGKSRYFLEHYSYQDTSVNKLLFVYYTKNIFNVGEVMLIKMVKSFLWYFTIIGGLIKHYEYSMIPYLLAENPTIKAQDAFNISKKMTNGHKKELFLLDLNFLPWYIIGPLTFGITNIFYFRPYKEMLKASIYLEYRRPLLEEYPNIFKDNYLECPSTPGAYPDNLYFIKEIRTVKGFKYDYNCDYDIWDLILIFFNVANIGWLWEILLCLIFEERLVNKGTMLGPWLPIYGFGAVFIIVLLKKYRQKPYQLFLMAFLLCGILEYGTAWYLETFKGLKWWDYTGFFLNIHGRVCLEGLMLFGFGGCILTYMVCPLLKNIYKKIKPNVKKTICIILVCLYLMDLGYSHFHPNTGVGITSPAKININIDRN